jgi:cytochrome c biogenesis protein CcmG/thiol:disulfide interchange protein DsbE
VIRFRLSAAAAVALLLAGCTASAEPDKPEISSPFASCTALTASTPVTSELPDVELPCFTGGEPLRVRDIHLPAVINIWASYCEPCREELPVMQGLADRSEGRLTVLGVDSADRREAAASFAVDHGVTFPTLFDPDRRLATELGQATLPLTVFVDADGGMYVHRTPLDVDELIEKVREHTGVTVTR